jgi:tetratricopeptide (TPR) repeat protein
MPARRLILVCWDAADWKVINPLLDSGCLPHLSDLIARGVMGNLASLAPPVVPLLWTSLITGKTADRHGILGVIEPDPTTGGARSSAATSRKVKALWNILAQSGLRVQVLGFPVTHPAEPVRGEFVSDAFAKISGPVGEPWPLPPGAVYPGDLEHRLASLRVHPHELTAEELLPFVPEAARIDQKKDRRLVPLVAALAESISVHSAATRLLEESPAEFTALYYGATGVASRAFMQYRPPRMDHVTEEDFLIYKGVIDGVCRFQDMMLGRVLHLAGPDATVIVVSANGVYSDGMRPIETGPENRELWLRPHGIFCLAGPGARRDELIIGAELLDVVPTVLAMFGLPAGQDMPGRVLVEAFEEMTPPAPIPSWEDVPGESGMHAPERDEDVRAAAVSIQELSELGYRDIIPEPVRKQACLARAIRTFNLARVAWGAGRIKDALELCEEGLREDPGNRAFQILLAQCCYLEGRIERCREVVAGLPGLDADPFISNLVRGMLALAEGEAEEGKSHFLAAERAPNVRPQSVCTVGLVYLNAKLWQDAERVFRGAIEAEPELAQAHLGHARALWEMGRAPLAAEAALEAIRLDFHLPEAHFLLGAALAHQGIISRAVQALEISLKLNPAFACSHAWLATIHEQATGDPERAEFHRRKAQELTAAQEAFRP